MTSSTAPSLAPELFFFGICPRGLEPALVIELTALGAREVKAAAGGVAFKGDQRIGYAANLHSRIASRVLRQVNQGRYRNDDDIYKIAHRTPWEQWLSHELTLRVDLNATRSPLRSLNFATLRVKDGICDRLREQLGERPSINTESPDTRVFAYLDDRLATLYVDWSGPSLFKRGWRGEVDSKGAAPLKENLAAGLLQLSGWSPSADLIDPFCGSGTIVIEAAQIAAGMAPGLQRSFGFERLKDFESGVWNELRRAAAAHSESVQRSNRVRIVGSDIDAQAIEQARVNLVRAGLPGNAVRFEVKSAQQQRPASGQTGMIVTNPPYGERIEFQNDSRKTGRLIPAQKRAGVGTLGGHWKEAFVGWRINVLSNDRDLPLQLALKERRKTPVFNGNLECRLFSFEVFEPKARAAPDPSPANTND